MQKTFGALFAVIIIFLLILITAFQFDFSSIEGRGKIQKQNADFVYSNVPKLEGIRGHLITEKLDHFYNDRNYRPQLEIWIGDVGKNTESQLQKNINTSNYTMQSTSSVGAYVNNIVDGDELLKVDNGEKIEELNGNGICEQCEK